MAKPKSSVSKWPKAFFWAVVLTAVIYLIVRKIDTFGNVLLVLLGLGVVILVHEFGHFVFAKLSGIKVEAFSIGFPPTLLGFQRTEDGLRLRILPAFFSGKETDQSEDDAGRPDQSEDDAGRADQGEDDNRRTKEGLLSFTIGGGGKAWDTEYCIGLIPVGGYVKMLGQEDTASAKSSDDPRSFANKPVGARAVVVSAGVVFNVIAAVIIFMVVFLIGINQPPALVGVVEPNSPAARAGLEAGDEIIEIDGKSNNLDFTDIMLAAALSGRGEEVSLKVQRDGLERDFTLVAEQRPDRPLKTFGFMMPQTLTVAEPVDEADVNDLRARTGLAPGDRIKSANAKLIEKHWELIPIVESTYAPTVKLSAQRTTETGETELVEGRIEMEWTIAGGSEGNSVPELYHVHSMVPRLQVTTVSGVPDRLGRGGLVNRVKNRILSIFGRPQEPNITYPDLESGDIILAIGDVPNPTYNEMRKLTEEYEDKEVRMEVLRTDANGAEEPVTVMVTPKRPAGSEKVLIGVALALDAGHAVVAKTIAGEAGPAKLDIPRGAVITAVDGTAVSSFHDVVREISKYPDERITIEYRLDDETAGAVALNVGTGRESITVKPIPAVLVEFETLKRLYKARGPVDAVVMGGRKTVTLIAQTYLTLKRLVSGLVSPKELMGPVGILAVSYQTVAEKMWIEYLFLIGLINAAIAVFNFLPLPPLDGGLAVLLVVEKIKGSAVSERTQGFLIRAGLVLVLALFLYITLNDVIRNFFS
ncbi:MAG: site-2 protease family protein [Planctomycetes bacterium]|nr:site-2 protease family protein [Planctomycetota bacterium]